ncbi:ATP-binding protein [Brucella sp. HL-2]|nr:ATP-binding protein [Brucella sp. HL-2]MCV9910019.1 ATP-binding protein [Brucella sp. HL-2]
MKIERAVREKTFTLTSIAGPSGSGKTYSALLYARGLVGQEGKIGFIDTENKRSRFYADVAGGFDVIDLDPPFTSSRYIQAIKAFEKAGYTAIIIDSISHEWEGIRSTTTNE